MMGDAQASAGLTLLTLGDVKLLGVALLHRLLTSATTLARSVAALAALQLLHKNIPPVASP
jgi:hypothetical protein